MPVTGHKPFIGPVVNVYEEIPMTAQNMSYMRMYCLQIRNFTNTAFRKTDSRLSYLRFKYVSHLKVIFQQLKLIQLLEPSTKSLCYSILRNCWDINWQIEYQAVLEYLSNSSGFALHGRSGRRERDIVSSNKVFLSILEILEGIKPELWIPTTVFPRYNYRKESKQHYTEIPCDVDNLLEEFTLKVRSYLQKYKLKGLFVPPLEVILKGANSKFHDNGQVKTDREIPSRLRSGFKLQVFNTKPLITREVWLPDKYTKINNSFWMIIGRQLLKNDPVYPFEDPLETWESIKKKLAMVFEFDISAFGLQYPRPYLSVVADEICKLYPDESMFEYSTILKEIMSSVRVLQEDGSYKYPVRGIGLGYYEDLKTIGVRAILEDFKPISVYGDQGLLPVKSMKTCEGVEDLKRFGFVLDDGKANIRFYNVKWSGYSMSQKECKRPKQVLEPLISFVRSEYHFERKLILKSYAEQNPERYLRYSKYIPQFYELTFGYEFAKGDSYWNLDNGGTSSLSPKMTGNLRSWKSEKMWSPSESLDGAILFENPFLARYKRGDAKRFSISRKSAYKNSHACSTDIRDFATPIYKLNKVRKPKMSNLARSVSDSTEERLLVLYKMSTGKVNFGLNTEEMEHALRLCSKARNPFEAYATGGYTVSTVYRGVSAPSAEWRWLLDRISTSTDLMYATMAPYFDVLRPQVPASMMDNHGAEVKRKRIPMSTVIPRKSPWETQSLKRLKLSDVIENPVLIKPFVEHDEPKKISDLFENLSSKFGDLVDNSGFIFNDDDIDLDLEEDLLDLSDLEYTPQSPS